MVIFGTMDQSFNKGERLQSRKIIDLLFEKGRSFTIEPIRIISLEAELKATFPVQVLLAVPKKNVPKAVHRNKVRRRMREAYRRHKNLLYEQLGSSGKTMAIALVYTGREVLAYSDIEEKIILCLQRLGGVNEKDAQ